MNSYFSCTINSRSEYIATILKEESFAASLGSIGLRNTTHIPLLNLQIGSITILSENSRSFYLLCQQCERK